MAKMYILKNFPFSMAYPMISLSYVISMFAAILFFHETVLPISLYGCGLGDVAYKLRVLHVIMDFLHVSAFYVSAHQICGDGIGGQIVKFFKGLVPGILETDSALLVDFQEVVAVNIPLDPYRTLVLAAFNKFSLSESRKGNQTHERQ